MLDKIHQLTRSHGELRTGKGLVSGIVALSLGILCFLGVLAFHFPEYLTTPQLRKSYDVALLRQVLYGALVVAGAVEESVNTAVDAEQIDRVVAAALAYLPASKAAALAANLTGCTRDAAYEVAVRLAAARR